uniref:Uncharacterized protein n=1 Tax=Anopheles quadriannulatus TaxID=34691 RepID=A0A182XPS9_ANOQN
MARCRYMPQHTLPSAHRDCESITLPAAHHARSSRNREGTSPPYARRRLRHPRGGRQHEPGTGCWNGQGRIRNGSRCPHTASDKCPGGRVTAQVNIAARIIEFNGRGSAVLTEFLCSTRGTTGTDHWLNTSPTGLWYDATSAGLCLNASKVVANPS